MSGRSSLSRSRRAGPRLARRLLRPTGTPSLSGAGPPALVVLRIAVALAVTAGVATVMAIVGVFGASAGGAAAVGCASVTAASALAAACGLTARARHGYRRRQQEPVGDGSDPRSIGAA